ncbi:hypothetical protein JTE90_026514 [Oedothorax gibbosus]|uniref:Uncharacterized protein n=1 Tax=Oedothorax gibbosus TaxID=931172 RepID=A0AAV6VS09_9ARAC|nr:hypothetical protein JTE90_026514 [Oedothorax gibbosus]
MTTHLGPTKILQSYTSNPNWCQRTTDYVVESAGRRAVDLAEVERGKCQGLRSGSHAEKGPNRLRDAIPIRKDGRPRVRPKFPQRIAVTRS